MTPFYEKTIICGVLAMFIDGVAIQEIGKFYWLSDREINEIIDEYIMALDGI